MEIIKYIKWKKIVNNYNLKSGDLSPGQLTQIQKIIKDFIKQNK